MQHVLRDSVGHVLMKGQVVTNSGWSNPATCQKEPVALEDDQSAGMTNVEKDVKVGALGEHLRTEYRKRIPRAYGVARSADDLQGSSLERATPGSGSLGGPQIEKIECEYDAFIEREMVHTGDLDRDPDSWCVTTQTTQDTRGRVRTKRVLQCGTH